MKSSSFLVCCVVLAAALTACKGNTPAPAESEPKPATVVRTERAAKVEVDTSAPANVGAVPEEAQRSDSGLAWVVLTESAGDAHPAEGDMVVMNFIGWTAEGKLVQESLSNGRSASIAFGALFPGWREGLQLMVPGEKRRLWIPGKLAHGEVKPGEPPAEQGPPLGMLVYDVELISFDKAPPRPATPVPAPSE
ncbi:MAG: FKBP-type peptidyl-prolyl cis-trans isomerase [Deltaproteobacteria bacterium]|nr:FKBP-type peptidyl-prolyl cis-trans isomerase [Deltaproteobacteria bacterium]MBW2159902.1 FKBP-type peptidyl-prolyl cis-trans isomerase [Deltaproteobacteria bacterium]